MYTPVEMDDYMLRQLENWRALAGRTHRPFRYTVNQKTAWSPLRNPLAAARVALVSSAGVHRRDQPVYDLDNPLGDWSYRMIDGGTPTGELAFSHTHYDHTDADADPNCMFPLDRLRELAAAGVIGSVAPTHVGLMGFQPDPRPLLTETAPRIIADLRSAAVDAVVLSPG